MTQEKSYKLKQRNNQRFVQKKFFFHKKIVEFFSITFVFFVLTVIYLFPLLQGLILLPLDMLVSNYAPWYSPGQILVKNPYMQDSIIQLFPWKHLVFQSFQINMIPFWNPYQLMGTPFMASMKPMVFYPLNILFILGEVNAWNMLLFLQIFLSLLFMYLLARSFKLNIFASIFASFVFSFNTLMIGVLEFGSDGHALVWLPVFLLCAKKFIDEKKGIYLSLLGLSIGISIFAGQLQYTGYALVLLTAFILFYGYSLRTAISAYALLFVAVLLGIGISAVQLFPGMELFSHSYRGTGNSYQVFAGGLNRPYQIFRLFAPDFFGNPVTRDATIGYIESLGYFGIIPLFFALYASVFVWRNILVKFFSIAAIIALLLSLQGIGQILYVLHVPLLTSGEGDRIFYLTYISCAILTGIGITEFLASKETKRNIVSICVFLAIFISIAASTILIHHSNIAFVKSFIHNIQFAILILGGFFIGTLLYFLLKKRFTNLEIVFLFFILGLTYFDFFRIGYRFLTFSNDKFLYPQLTATSYIQQHEKNTLARNIGLTEPELASYLNVYTIETYNPLYLLKSAEVMQALQKHNTKSLPMNKYFVDKGENLKYALDFLGVSYIVDDKDANPSIDFFNSSKFQNEFILVYKDNRYAVYKNRTAFPRFGLYYQDKVIDNDSKMLATIARRNIDLRHTVLLQEKLPIILQKGTGSVSLVANNINAQTFKAKTTQPALFYISDTFYPGWQATVNNTKAKIYQANYNFRAVLIPKGTSVISFNYIPDFFVFGIITSVASLILLLCFAVKPLASSIFSNF